jgi:hypothetical protein
VAIPIDTALNSTSSTAVTTAAALLTIGLSLMMMWITNRLVAAQPAEAISLLPVDRQRTAEALVV